MLTDKEVKSLTKWYPKKSLTKQQVKKDLDLYFRALESAYGAYYYFGADKFEKAKQEMMRWADGLTKKIDREQMGRELTKKLSFVRDAHFSAGDGWNSMAKGRAYQYYYALNRSYEKDENGFFTYLDASDEKWYVEAFGDKRVTLKPTLRSNGTVVYAPTLWCPAKDKKNTTVTLKNSEGKVKNKTVSFSKGEPYGYDRVNNFQQAEGKGILYLSIRSFDSKMDYGYDDFVKSGIKAKNAKVVIFDIRSNRGGGDEFGRQWVKSFSGREPEVKAAFAMRGSKIGQEVLGRTEKPGTFSTGTYPGQMIPNDIPIIVLTDNLCGSAGEDMLNYLKTLENTIVIGSHSAGYQIAGNAYKYMLPESGMSFGFGASLSMYFTEENVDYQGYEPDIWCNPDEALDSVLALIQYNNPNTDYTQIFRQIKKKTELPDIKLYNEGGETAWGGQTKTTTLQVFHDGKRTKNFTVTTDVPGICKCIKTADGKIKVKVVGKGSCQIIVKCGDEKKSFLWYSAIQK